MLAARSAVVPLGQVMLCSVYECDDCFGSRAVPDVFGDYQACPSCVIDAGNTFVVYEAEGDS